MKAPPAPITYMKRMVMKIFIKVRPLWLDESEGCDIFFIDITLQTNEFEIPFVIPPYSRCETNAILVS